MSSCLMKIWVGLCLTNGVPLGTLYPVNPAKLVRSVGVRGGSLSTCFHGTTSNGRQWEANSLIVVMESAPRFCPIMSCVINRVPNLVSSLSCSRCERIPTKRIQGSQQVTKRRTNQVFRGASTLNDQVTVSEHPAAVLMAKPCGFSGYHGISSGYPISSRNSANSVPSNSSIR